MTYPGREDILSIEEFYIRRVGISMNFGQLVTATSRKEWACHHCGKPSEVGVVYVGLLYKKIGPNKRTFLNRFHKECLLGYLEASKEVREEAIVEKRKSVGGKGGRPRATASPEEAYSRELVQHTIWKWKDRLVKAYEEGNEALIRSRWLGLADILDKYEAIGGEYHSLGPKVSEILRERQDLAAKIAECNRRPGLVAEVIRNEWNAQEAA